MTNLILLCSHGCRPISVTLKSKKNHLRKCTVYFFLSNTIPCGHTLNLHIKTKCPYVNRWRTQPPNCTFLMHCNLPNGVYTHKSFIDLPTTCLQSEISFCSAPEAPIQYTGWSTRTEIEENAGSCTVTKVCNLGFLQQLSTVWFKRMLFSQRPNLNIYDGGVFVFVVGWYFTCFLSQYLYVSKKLVPIYRTRKLLGYNFKNFAYSLTPFD